MSKKERADVPWSSHTGSIQQNCQKGLTYKTTADQSLQLERTRCPHKKNSAASVASTCFFIGRKTTPTSPFFFFFSPVSYVIAFARVTGLLFNSFLDHQGRLELSNASLLWHGTARDWLDYPQQSARLVCLAIGPPGPQSLPLF